MLEDIEKLVDNYHSSADRPYMKFIKRESDFVVIVVTNFMRRILWGWDICVPIRMKNFFNWDNVVPNHFE